MHTVRELGSGRLSGTNHQDVENGSAPRKIKLANTAKKSKALMITGPAIWSAYRTHSYSYPLRDSHGLRKTNKEGRTEGTRITSADHGDSMLV